MEYGHSDLSRLWRTYSAFAFPEGVTRHEALKALLVDAWTEETCSPRFRSDWRPGSALGQVEPTVLLVQDLCEGDILRVQLNGDERHYYNRLPLGEGYVDDDLCLPLDKHAPERASARVITRVDFLRENESRVLSVQERYLQLRDRAHFLMARAIR